MQDAINVLRKELQRLQGLPADDYAESLPPELKTAQHSHNDFVIAKLLDILTPLNPIETETDLKKIQINLKYFLEVLHGFFVNSSFDYTHHPRLPANQACLRVAEWLRTENEPVCHILMPTVRSVIGGTFLDLRMDTEQDGKFDPHYFMLNEKGDRLIDVATVFQMSSGETAHLFLPSGLESILRSDAQSQYVAPTFDLTDSEHQAIRTIAGDTSRVYYDALKRKHENPSVGSALRELMWSLHLASKMKNGIESEADLVSCLPVIARFYEIWCALPEVVQEVVKTVKASHGASYTLGNYLLRLFLILHSGDRVQLESDCAVLINEASVQFQALLPVTAENLALSETRGTRAWLFTQPDWVRYIYNIYPCADLISKQLADILNPVDGFASNGQDLFKIPLSGQCDGSTLPSLSSSQDSATLNIALTTALSCRKPMMGTEDQSYLRRKKLFDMIVTNYFNPISFLDNLVGHTENIIQLTDILTMLPPCDWKLLKRSMSPLRLKVIFLNNTFTTANAFLYLLKYIPSERWQSLFDDALVLYETGLMRAHDLGQILCDFPHDQRDYLMSVLHPLLSTMLEDSLDLLGLLSPFIEQTPELTPDDYREVLHYFRDVIEEIFKKPIELARFFNLQPVLDAGELLYYFNSESKRIYFGNIASISNVFKHVRIEKRFIFLNEYLGFQHLNEKIQSVEDIAFFLNLLNQYARHQFILKLEKFGSLIAGDGFEKLFVLLKEEYRFPYLNAIGIIMPIHMAVTTEALLFRLFQMLPVHDWERFTKLLGHGTLTKIIGGCVGLPNFVRRFNDISERVLCIKALSEFIVESVSSGFTLKRIMEELPELSVFLTHIMKPKLPSYIELMLNDIESNTRFQIPSSLQIESLNFLLKYALPILFSQEYLENKWSCACFPDAMHLIPFPDVVIFKLRKVERSRLENDSDHFLAALEKFEILAKFVETRVDAIFCNMLKADFGALFFRKLSAYIAAHPELKTPAELSFSDIHLFFGNNTRQTINPTFMPGATFFRFPQLMRGMNTADGNTPGVSHVGRALH